MSTKIFGTAALLGTLIGPVVVISAQEGASWWNKPSQSVFVVTPNHYAEGFGPAGSTARFGELVMIEIFKPSGKSGSEATYEVGKRYKLYSGGENVGQVKVERIVPLQCDSSAALVSVDGSFRFSKDTIALATNAGAVRTHANMKRAADESQRSTMMRLAALELRKRGLAPAQGATLKIDDLVATTVGGGGAETLIGSLSILLRGARHEVFLIVGPQSRIEMSRYHKTNDVDDGKDSQNMRFADQLDLDGDGTDEVVVEVTGYENEEFWIYKRQGGFWARVWVGGKGGC